MVFPSANRKSIKNRVPVFWSKLTNSLKESCKKAYDVYVKHWPLILGVIISVYPEVATSAHNLWLKISGQLKNPETYEKDWWAILVWVFFIVWFFADKQSEKRKNIERKLAAEKMHKAVKDDYTEKLEEVKSEMQRANFELTASWLAISTASNSALSTSWSKENAILQSELQNATEILTAAIHNAPNTNIFFIVFHISDEIFDDLQSLHTHKKQGFYRRKKNELAKAYEATFKKILILLCRITQHFLKSRYNNYSANIMYFIKSNEDTQTLIKKMVEDKSSFVYLNNIPSEEIFGILYSPIELMEKIGIDVTFSTVTIPIKEKPKANEIIPGAPRATVYGHSVIRNTDLDSDIEFANLSHDVKADFASFFSSEKGGHIKSFLSMKVPALEKSIANSEVGKNQIDFQGVINIYSQDLCLLGEELKYYETYFAIVEPLIKLLSPFLQDYFSLFHNKLEKKYNLKSTPNRR